MAFRPRVSYDITSNDATAKGVNSANKRLGSLKTQFGSVSGAAKGGAAAIALAVAEIVRLGEQSIQTRNRLRSATDSIREQEFVLSSLRRQSQETGIAIESSIDAFAGLDRVQEDIGLTTANMVQLTATIQKSGVISGRTNEDIKLGIRGLSQALAQNVVRAEEYNQILDNTPDIIKRVADNLKLSGGQLRQQIVDGKILSSVFAVSILQATKDVEDEYAELDLTAGRAFAGLKEGYRGAIDDSETLLSLNRTLAQVLLGVNEALFGSSTLDGKIKEVEQELALRLKLKKVNEDAIARGEGTNFLKDILGTDSISNIKEHNIQIKKLTERLEDLRGLSTAGTDASRVRLEALNKAGFNEALRQTEEGIKARDKAAKLSAKAAASEAKRKAAADKAEFARNQRKAERDKQQRIVDIADRVADNKKLFSQLREDALLGSKQLVTVERERLKETLDIITAAENQAEADGNRAEQAAQFAQARIDAEQATADKIVAIRKNQNQAIRDLEEQEHQLALQVNFERFEEQLAIELGYKSRRNMELVQQERDLQLALFAETTRGNAIAQKAARITADFAVRMERNKVGAITGLLTDLSGVLASHSKTAFKINKVAGIANAIVNTSVGVSKALELPWPLNLVAAASVAAVGAAEIATIKSTSFGGGGGGGGGGISTGGGGGAPQIPDLPDIPTVTAEDRNAVTLRLVVDAEGGNLSQALGEAIRTEVDERGLVVIGPNSAQAEAIRTGSTT